MIATIVQMIVYNSTNALWIKNAAAKATFVQEESTNERPQFSAQPKTQSLVRLVTRNSEFGKDFEPGFCREFCDAICSDARASIDIHHIQQFSAPATKNVSLDCIVQFQFWRS